MLALIFKDSRFLSMVKDGKNKGSKAGNFNEGTPLTRYGVSACSCFKTHLLYSGKFVRGHDVTPGAENIDRTLVPILVIMIYIN